MSSQQGALLNWASIISLGVGNAMALDFMERVFSAKSPETAAKACYYAAGWTIVTGVAAALVGLAALQLLPANSEPRMVLPLLATNHLPYAIGVMVFVGVLGASMSTANGGMLVIAVVLARNVWQRWQKDAVPDAKMLFLSRALAVPASIAAALIAYWRPDPGILLVVAFDIVFAGCVVPLFLGVYWRRATAAGAIASIVTGTAARGGVLSDARVAGRARHAAAALAFGGRVRCRLSCASRRAHGGAEVRPSLHAGA